MAIPEKRLLQHFLTIDSLDDPRLVVFSPFAVEAHYDDDGVTLHHVDSGVFGFGVDEAEALQDFRAALAELFLTLDGDRTSLGPALEETLRVLEESIRKSS